MLNLSKIKIQEPESNETPGHFIEGRVAKIKMGPGAGGERFHEGQKSNIRNQVRSRDRGVAEGKVKCIGYIGEIHPKILKNWRIKMPVALLEINLDDLLNQIK